MEKKRVLIIEDDDMLVKTLAERLSTDGFEVLTEMDGESGLLSVRENVPDIVILDLTIPKMDGVEVLKNIRSDSKTASIPVIVSTNRDDIETVGQALESGGMIDFLAKHEWKLEDIATLVKKRLGISDS